MDSFLARYTRELDLAADPRLIARPASSEQTPREPGSAVSVYGGISFPAPFDPDRFLAAQTLRERATATAATPHHGGQKLRQRATAPAAPHLGVNIATTTATPLTSEHPAPPGVIRRTTERKARRAKEGNELAYSEFRPNVPAKDRMRCWTTPWIQDMEADASRRVGGNLLAQAFEAAIDGCVEKTDASYGAGLLRWAQFGDRHGISERDRMPADALLLAAFAADDRGDISGKTAGARLAAVRRQHHLARAPWYGDDEWVKLTRKTVNREGSTHQRPPRPPVTTAYMRALRAGLDLKTSLDAAIWACATAAFWGCRRLGELTVPGEKEFNPQFHVLRGVELRFGDAASGVVSATFHIPWTKTTREQGAEVVLTGRPDELCPVAAMRNHLKVNAGAPDSAHLLAHGSNEKGFRPLVKTRMMDRCNAIWSAANLEALVGHGFRIGGASEMLLAGVNPNVIASLGGWTSLAFLLYWRKLEGILPKAISGAYSRDQIGRVIASMEAFRVRSGVPKNVEDVAFSN